MANFEVKVVRVDSVEKHPNADRLDIVKIAGFNCISGRFEDGTPQYRAGDLCVYIPEGAVLTEPVLRYNGFWDEANGKGQLAGSDGNRVKAIKLRGIVSQGILHPVNAYFGEKRDGILYEPNDGTALYVNVGQDVSSSLQITKYEPVIPASMSGDMLFLGTDKTLKYDIENIQKYPHVFEDGEEVVVTEKLHGTFCAFGYSPQLGHPDLLEGSFYAFSKSLGAEGLVFKDSESNRLKNVYHKALHAHVEQLRALHNHFLFENEDIIVCGELYGPGIQDLTYGEVAPKFRVFDVYVRAEDDLGNGYINAEDVFYNTIRNFFDTVPVIYKGPYSWSTIEKFRDGQTSITQAHLREGVVVKPAEERRDETLGGRVALKAVSPDYLLRKNPNATEFN